MQLAICSCLPAWWRGRLSEGPNPVVALLRNAKGQPFPKITGPLPHERVCVVGAGAAGIHMALSLKKRGYNRVTIFEKTNRVGGKSYDVKYKGLSQPMSTLYLLPDYFDTFVPVAREYGQGNLRPISKIQVRIFH